MDGGGSIAMAVLNAQYKHPSTSIYSEGLRKLIDSMLVADPKDRPDIHQVCLSSMLQTRRKSDKTKVIKAADQLLANL